MSDTGYGRREGSSREVTCKKMVGNFPKLRKSIFLSVKEVRIRIKSTPRRFLMLTADPSKIKRRS